MSELVNTFSWSISAREDFGECRRRRYWAKYAMWNGWKENASAIQRAAYRLAKMENRFTLVGNAVELGVRWLIERKQAGAAAGAEEAYEAAARSYLNRCWDDSLKKKWQLNPKKHCCLHEHYYRQFASKSDREMAGEMMTRVKLCLSNFAAKVLPQLDAAREQEIAITTVAAGDPESFTFNGIKIYAIPDYAYLKKGTLHIHDWKSGATRESHNDQMAVYGLWAAMKHNIAPGQVNIHLEYLASGVTESQVLTEDTLLKAQELINDSVGEMAEYLVEGDIKRNEPLPKEDWELSADLTACHKCNFYELCKPELE